MRRSSPYFDLKYRVDCRQPGMAFYETIVAFNSDRVALQYAEKCRRNHSPIPGIGDWDYRVLARRGNRWVEITQEESF